MVMAVMVVIAMATMMMQRWETVRMMMVATMMHMVMVMVMVLVKMNAMEITRTQTMFMIWYAARFPAETRIESGDILRLAQGEIRRYIRAGKCPCSSEGYASQARKLNFSSCHPHRRAGPFSIPLPLPLPLPLPFSSRRNCQ